jgi:WS/DGAT/MGAT family acyltransferase
MTAFSEPLSPLDALFLYLESPRTPMHAGSVAIFEGNAFKNRDGVVHIEAIREQIGRRLDLVPKLRQRVRSPRIGQGGPVWVDDSAFDIAHHVRHIALPAPGTELLELSGKLLAVPIDRAHPLWELWFVEGLEGERIGLVEKVHHALADGLASVELATVLLDFESHPALSEAPVSLPWRSRPEPREATVVARDLVRRGTAPVRTGLSLLGTLEHPVHSIRRATELAGALGTLTTPRTIAPRSSINVAVGQGRRVAFVRQALDPLKAVERRFGVTINDVLLAAVSGGLRAQLIGRGESVAGVTLQALVPVGMDPHGDHRLGNRVSAMIVRLPLAKADPVARLVAVSQAIGRCKERRQALVGGYITRALDPWPRSALSVGAHLVHRQRLVNLVITNVPGPPVPLYSMGARMLEAFPIVPLAGNLSLGVAAFSYDGQLSIGILADRDRCPDVDVLARGIGTSFTELLAAAGKDTAESDPYATATPEPSPTPDGSPGRRRPRTHAVDHRTIPSHGVVREGSRRARAGKQSGGETPVRRPAREVPPAQSHQPSGPKRERTP